MPTNAFAAGAYATTQNLTALGTRIGAGTSADKGPDFGSLLQGAVNAVAEAGRKADSQAMATVAGRTDIVDVVTAVAESEAALGTLVAVRDRVIAAYEDIMRMPI